MLELIGGVILMTILCGLFLISRFKRCPVDKILIVYGKTGGDHSAKIYTSGGVFIWPVIQDYAYLDRKPLKVSTTIKRAQDKDGNHAEISGVFIVAVGDTTALMESAAKRLLNLDSSQIVSLSEKVIRAELHLVVSILASVELIDRNQLITTIYASVNEQLNILGLRLINVDLNDVQATSLQAANYTWKASTEEPEVSDKKAVVLELNQEQVGALLQGTIIELPLPNGRPSVRLSVRPTTN